MKTRMVYTGIRVTDLNRAVDFYTKVLGMEEVGRQRVEAASGIVVNLRTSADGPILELNFYDKGSTFDTPYTPGEGLDHLAFEVENLDSAVGEAAKLGHPVVLEVKGKSGKWVYIQDPDGNYIELME